MHRDAHTAHDDRSRPDPEEPPGGRSLEALGLAEVPLLAPLSYPGRPVPWPALLLGRRLLRLTPPGGRRAEAGTGRGPEAGECGTWQVGDGAPADGRPALDAVLDRAGAAPVAERTPVVAVGSNASPAQISHKLASADLPGAVPMCPVRVGGIGVGVSAHISRAGYVSAAPFTDPGGGAGLTVTWLDPDQLAAVDASEFAFRRIPVPGTVRLPSGEPLPGCGMYAHRTGVLTAPGGREPWRTGPQRPLIRALLGRSARLRALFGTGGDGPGGDGPGGGLTSQDPPVDPAGFVARASGDPALREAAAALFRESGWVLPQHFGG